MALSFARRILSACWHGGRAKVVADAARGSQGSSCRRLLARGRSAAPGSIDCFGLTDIGKVRKNNEDQFFIVDLGRSLTGCEANSAPRDTREGEGISNANLLLVADGVGGHSGGERASKLAVEGAVKYLRANRTRLSRSAGCACNAIKEELTSALVSAQQHLQREAEASPHHVRMGTTLTLAYLDWPKVYIAHAGDSRVYLFRPPDLLQLTHDQTVAQLLADAGAIEADRVENHPWRNVLGSLLCCDVRQLLPGTYQKDLMPGDQLLLCTDGLTKHVPAVQIAEILNSAYTTEDACHALVAAANSAGGTDNTTVVLARFGRWNREVNRDLATFKEAPATNQSSEAVAFLA